MGENRLTFFLQGLCCKKKEARNGPLNALQRGCAKDRNRTACITVI